MAKTGKLHIFLNLGIAQKTVAICLTLLISSFPALADPPLKRIHRPGCDAPLAPTESFKFDQRASIVPRYQAASSTELTLIVAYTPQVLSALGSHNAVLDEVKYMISFANRAHANSETGIGISLVYVHPLTSNATDTFSTDLEAATNLDGTWDELHTLRSTYGADLVTVLVAGTQSGKYCGLGWLNGGANNLASAAAYMFNIVSIHKSCFRSALVHEIGHNMGCDHDRQHAAGGAYQGYSYGYRFTGNSKQLWNTIMGVPSTANYREVPYFSSPEFSIDGKAIGVADSEDNIRSLTLAAPTVAALVDPTDTPNLAIPAPGEPTSIKASYRKSANRKSIIITTTLSGQNLRTYYQPVLIYFTRGKRGPASLRAIGRTNSRGTYSFRESARVSKGYFYKSCYAGANKSFLCSKPFELAKT